MTAELFLDIAREAIYVYLKMSLPLLLAALFTGLVISLLQALTQIQEMTLVFVPKIIVMFLVFLLFLPFMGIALYDYFQELNRYIIEQ